MYNKVLMQFKREFWEHNGVLYKVPAVLVTVVVGLFFLFMSYSVLTNKVHFLASGHILTTESDVKVEWLIDSENLPKATTVIVDHEFSRQPHIVANDYPELIRVFDPVEPEPGPRHLQHIYKQKIDKRLSHFSITFDMILIMSIGGLLVASMASGIKDKSNLFWRALPVSETQVVLTKFFTMTCVVPMVYYLSFFIIALSGLSIFALVEMFISDNGLEISQVIWDVTLLFLSMSKGFIFYILWFSPVYAFLLLLLVQYPLISWGVSFLLSGLFLLIVVVIIVKVDVTLFEYIPEYFSTGFDIGQKLKWGLIWERVAPTIPYLSLCIAMACTALFLTINIQVRQRRDM